MIFTLKCLDASHNIFLKEVSVGYFFTIVTCYALKYFLNY